MEIILFLSMNSESIKNKKVINANSLGSSLDKSD